MHIGVSNGFIVAHVITDDKTHDGSIASQLIQQVGEIDSITADKGYDQTQVQQSAYDHLREGGKINIHPRKNAVISESEEAAQKMLMRDNEINTLRRSMKMVFWLGEEHQATTVRAKLKTCSFDTKNYLVMRSTREIKNSRLVESVIVCNILNQFRLLGKPEYELAA